MYLSSLKITTLQRTSWCFHLIQTCLWFISNHGCWYMQECGPRFTLKLISLQHGTFDTKGGEYEWVHKVILCYLRICCYLCNNAILLVASLSISSFRHITPYFVLYLPVHYQPEMDTSRRRFFLWDYYSCCEVEDKKFRTSDLELTYLMCTRFCSIGSVRAELSLFVIIFHFLNDKLSNSS